MLTSTKVSHPLDGRSILVLGGGGFIGSHTSEALVRAGAKVTIFGRSKPPFFIKADFIEAMLSDEYKLALAASQCDTAVFLTSASSPATGNGDLRREIEEHVGLTVRCAEVCQVNGISRIVFASSGGTVYGSDDPQPIDEMTACRPRNAYGASKLAIENYIRVLGTLRGVSTVSLRISNPYGPNQIARGQGFVAAAIQKILAEETIVIWGDGKAIRDFIYVSDVADAICQACYLPSTHRELNVGSGEGTELLSIIRQLEAITGQSAKLRFDSGRSIDVRANVLSIAAARERLKWGPSVALEDGLKRTVNWWLDKGT